ncbi:1,2-phenylacetyl-CoA epoxidase, subunit B [compost metagenome]
MHAADARMAIENARELYTRRNEGVSLWVVPSALITASAPDEKEPLFDPSQDKVYRHASFYELPAEVGHM